MKTNSLLERETKKPNKKIPKQTTPKPNNQKSPDKNQQKTLNTHQQILLKSMWKRNTSCVQKGRYLHDLHHSWKQRQSTKISDYLKEETFPKYIIFLLQKGERSTGIFNPKLSETNRIPIFLLKQKRLQLYCHVSKLTSDGTCSSPVIKALIFR